MQRTILEIFCAFLRLGLTSFGGPMAHIGYFQNEFVVRRRWLDEKAFADLVALCQLLPGPASSQAGFAIGLSRGGFLGGCAAWLGFTLPSAALMIAFAYGADAFQGKIGAAILHGLMIAAVAVVAQAVWNMARTLCPDRQRAVIALAATLIVLTFTGLFGQSAAIIFGALVGLALCCAEPSTSIGTLSLAVSQRTGILALVLFVALLAGLPIGAALFPNHTLTVIDGFYRSGALVFGGGHVVLPLLQAVTVPAGWIDNTAFLSGYGAAQAIPGPLFTFAAYLGAAMRMPPNGWLGGLIGLIAIFTPGFLILIGIMPFWNRFRNVPQAQSALRGVNAAVVGLLGAALYAPLGTATIHTAADFGLALGGFLLLLIGKIPPWSLVLGSAALTALIGI